jgi:3-hydroxymyristoyl/3-hydroxydecanoyl-(acyl carrier protein) dehydratase
MNLPPILAKRQADDTVVLDLSVPEELEIFRGHFPGMPILPGVAQIDWALKLAQAHGLVPGGAELRDFQVKFRSVIRPSVPLTLTLRRDCNKKRVYFDYHSAGALMSSGRLMVQAEPS